jgi:hypothetical protein
VVAPLPVPRGLGHLHEEEQLFVGSVSSTGGAQGKQTRHDRCSAVIAYYILRDKTCYQGLDPDYFDRLNPEGLRRRLTKRLEGLGFKVTLETVAQVT